MRHIPAERTRRVAPLSAHDCRCKAPAIWGAEQLRYLKEAFSLEIPYHGFFQKARKNRIFVLFITAGILLPGPFLKSQSSLKSLKSKVSKIKEFFQKCEAFLFTRQNLRKSQRKWTSPAGECAYHPVTPLYQSPGLCYDSF